MVMMAVSVMVPVSRRGRRRPVVSMSITSQKKIAYFWPSAEFPRCAAAYTGNSFDCVTRRTGRNIDGKAQKCTGEKNSTNKLLHVITSLYVSFFSLNNITEKLERYWKFVKFPLEKGWPDLRPSFSENAA